MTIAELLAEARRALAAAPFAPATREASLLLGRVLGFSEAQLLARSETPVPPNEEERFRRLLERRLHGEPVSYLTKEREFYGRTFHVDQRVLIPRPETEHLIEAALARDLPPRPWILDLGTGSGAIALTLALELPGSRVIATDLSVDALAVAALNRRRYGLEDRVALLACDLAAAVGLPRIDMLVSNPPYIDPADKPSLSPEIRDFEPDLALYASTHGLAIVERVLTTASKLRSGVPLLIEVGAGQGAELRQRLPSTTLAIEEVTRDYAGIERIVVLKRQ